MTWSDIINQLNSEYSLYMNSQSDKLRRGKYVDSDNYRDGYVSMIFETLSELSPSDEYNPLDKPKVRRMISAFNRLTKAHVTNTWNETISINYGYLYNWPAVNDSRYIASDGWKVPSKDDAIALSTYLGGNSISGGKMKEYGNNTWSYPNTGATNSSGLTIIASGERYFDDAMYQDMGNSSYIWTSTSPSAGLSWYLFLHNNAEELLISQQYTNSGFSIRLMRDNSPLSNGVAGKYIGNDGMVYPTITIGTQEWTSVNLAETKYRNGDSIEVITDDELWIAATSGAMCAYDNDIKNVFSIS